ncbi:MAG: Mrp/NBP35 family ATP-binding protein [Firmicutes bacterium]|nr:Mrp/NBP35 family ATP-binding protein [Bacillota bacterium]
MMSSCSGNCGSCSESCSDRKEKQSFLVEPNPMSSIKKVIGVVSGKGGVGKSLVTGTLASQLQKSGLKTAILDADITGPSIPKMFGLKEQAYGTSAGLYPCKTSNGIDVMSVNLIIDNEKTPLIWRSGLICGAVKQFWTDVIWEDIDCMLIDMPPGTGDVPLTVFQSIPLDGIIIVSTPQELVSMIVSKAVNMAEKMDIPILGIVENMSYFKCPDCGKEHHIFGSGSTEKTAKEFGLDIIATVPIDPEVARKCDSGKAADIDAYWFNDTIELIKKC